VISLGVKPGIPQISTNDELSDSALYIHVRCDTTVTWQISSSTQCNSDPSGQSQFSKISYRYLNTIFVCVFVVNSIFNLKLFFNIMVSISF